MTRGIEIAAIDSPGADARVCHYDQLSEGVKGRFPALVPEDDGRIVVETEEPAAFDACDVVKFTRYYQVGAAAERGACD